MDTRVLVLIAIVVVAAAAIAVYALYNGSQANNSPAGGAGEAAGGGGWGACGDGPAVAVVYARGQESLAGTLRSLLSRQLRDAMPNGTRFCVVDAGSVGLVDARVLPLILVRGEPSDPRLAAILANETLGPGFRPVLYDVDAMFVLQVAMSGAGGGPRYNAEAKLVILQGHYSFTKANVTRIENDKRALAILSALFAANITGVEELQPSEAPQRLLEAANGTLPAFFAESSNDLEAGTYRVESLGSGYYTLANESTTSALVQMGLTPAWEARAQPPPVEGHPSIGSGGLHVAVFEDFMCPFCAKFYNETMPLLLEAARQGKLVIHLLDLVVHREVLGLHQKLLCLYNATGNSTLYLEEASRLYKALTGSKTFQEYNATKAEIEEEIDKLLGNATCNVEAAQKLVGETSHWALMHGIRGTPGFAIWRDNSDIVVFSEGYHGKNFFEQVLKELSG